MDSYLRSEILEHFACNGKLSKSMVEEEFKQRLHVTRSGRHVKPHRPEILAVFEFHQNNGSIEELGFDPGPGQVYGRGRPKTYYRITKKGVRELMTDNHVSALDFWRILRDYCIKNGSLVTLEEINEFYHIVMGRYLRYSYHGFSFQIDNFHQMCNKWLEENILNSDEITAAQKVIEVLALNPRITLEELVKQTGESEYDVNQVLSPPPKPFYGLTQNAALESLGKTSQSNLESYNPEDDSNSKNHNTEYTDFLIKNIITSRQNKDGELTYELSLFGVMLSLALIRYNESAKLKAGLYFKNFSIQEYYDKIASKYKEKLPLIFGKWNLLNRILKEFAIYNFDTVIDKEKNHSSNALSEIVGGNKELCDGVTGITLCNKMLMMAFISDGWEVLKEYYQGMLFKLPHILKRPEFEKIYPLLYKFADIGIQLYPATNFPYWNPINFKLQDTSSILREMEESFAYEIAALYYVNLCNDLNKRVSSLSIDNSSKLLNRSPRECLSMILEQDKEGSLRKWFTKCMKDLEVFQHDILKITRANMRQMGIE